MSILEDKSILEYMKNNKIKITPPPEKIQIQPASVDLRLDSTYLTFDTTKHTCIDTRKEAKYTSRHVFTEEKPLVLQPSDFILASTVEFVCLPDNILGRVEGRSSFGRLGVTVHVTAGFIDPGFKGRITLEIVNLGNLPVVLYPNQRICQIVFEELVDSCESDYGVRGKYQCQYMVTESTVYKDKL